MSIIVLFSLFLFAAASPVLAGVAAVASAANVVALSSVFLFAGASPVLAGVAAVANVGAVAGNATTALVLPPDLKVQSRFPRL